MTALTTIVLQTAHDPTEKEVESLLDSLIAAGERLGVEPLRAQAIIVAPREVDRAGRRIRREELAATRVVHDGVKQGKWERGPRIGGR